MSTAVRITSTHTIPMDVIQAASWVGQIVTVDEQMYTVHSVEGPTWYAFNQDGQVTIDTDMTEVGITEPVATVIPQGTKIGSGFARQYNLNQLARRVSLTKW